MPWICHVPVNMDCTCPNPLYCKFRVDKNCKVDGLACDAQQIAEEPAVITIRDPQHPIGKI